MKKLNFSKWMTRASLTSLACIATLTAQLGAGAASSWGSYQPRVPEKLRR